MLDQGIHVHSDFSTLSFFNKHDAVVKAVLDGSVDAGTVRTDTLERMAAVGLLNMAKVKILARKNHNDFPFVCSTTLYPEWPLAKTANTDFTVVNKVVTALKLLTENDQASKRAKIVGWTDPLDYSSVEELQRDLKVGGYQ
jgi:twitching motility protein PilJ